MEQCEPQKKRPKRGNPSSAEGSHALPLQSAPAGPVTIEDFRRWPQSVARVLCPEEDPERRLRLQRHLLSGVDLGSDYSGLDCPRESLILGLQAVKEQLQCESIDEVVRIVRTCDKGNTQKKLQVSMANDVDEGKRWCHFDNIIDRLPVAGQAFVEAATPPASATKSERGEASQSLASWLLENRSWLFTKEATAPCLVHQRLVEGWGQSWESNPT